ncbi:Succinoglycan biosynthesis protein [Bacillus cereus m1550]|nr:Succinoglycan biosynthesis protein [Bacillus cereus m1550]
MIAFETGLWEAAAVQQNFDNSTAGFDMNLFYKSSFRSYAKEWLQKVNPEVKSEFDTAVSELIELDRYYNKNKTYFKNDIRLYEDAAIQLCWPKYDGLSSTAYQRPNGHNWCICV